MHVLSPLLRNRSTEGDEDAARGLLSWSHSSIGLFHQIIYHHYIEPTVRF